MTKNIETELTGEVGSFTDGNIVVTENESGEIRVTAKEQVPEFIVLETDYFCMEGALVCGDAWERGYGDLEWRETDPERVMPWYFAAYKNGTVYCFGVKTGPNAFCSWQCTDKKVSLVIDIRNGDQPAELAGRCLHACTVVMNEYKESAFFALQKFCKIMCDQPRNITRQIFGGNDWYCNYGNNSYEKIITHTKRIVECAPENSKPYMVIDDGWELCHRDSDGVNYNGGPWKYCNDNFRDMKKLAEEISEMGAIPGIWMRPLLTVEKVPEEYVLKKSGMKITLDPSCEKVLELVQRDIKTLKEWGYKLIKHDFSTYDLAGKWGFQMNLFECDVKFSDRTKTTAEIVKHFYEAIREAAGEDVLIMGCNTISHLSAGIFDIQRTGDDTSGKEWERTRKYGINTLSFRMPQHKNFYIADADCVGITRNVSWEKNRQWLDVLAKSGTALFVSIAEDAYTEEVKSDLKEAFEKSVQNTEPSEPLDWMETKTPQRWAGHFGSDEYNW